MGFFSNIANAIHEGKEKARLEAMEVGRRIEHADMLYSSKLMAEELRSASSIAKRVSLNQIFNEKLKKTDDLNELYLAFTMMYEQGKRSNSTATYAANLAQRIGRKLHNMGDLRVESNSDETYFAPKF